MQKVLAQALPQRRPAATPTTSNEGVQFRLQPRRRQVQSQSGNFPGATAPGTGARHFPEPHLQEGSEGGAWSRERDEKFDMKTTEEFYRDFPGLVRSSTPLYLQSAGPQEPLGKVEQKLQDAGPETGHRRMPSTVDHDGRQRPRLPSQQESEEGLRRERHIRHGLL